METNLVICYGKIAKGPLRENPSMMGASRAIRLSMRVSRSRRLALNVSACSLIPKLDELKILLIFFSVDVRYITVVLLSSTVLDTNVALEN